MGINVSYLRTRWRVNLRLIVKVFLFSASFTVIESFNLWRFSWKLLKHRMEQLHRQSDYVRIGT